MNKRIIHTYTAIVIMFMNMLLLVSCESEEKSTRWRTTPKGSKIFFANSGHNGYDNETYEWVGPTNPDSLAHGTGTLIIQSGNEVIRKNVFAFYGNLDYQPRQHCYFGDYNGNHQRDGFGVSIDGPVVSIGDFEDGNGCGKVRIYRQDVLIYDGEWKNDQPYGYGTLYSNDGNLQYYGEWKDGKPHGDGTMVNKKGLKYRHIWTNGELKEGTKTLYANLNSHIRELTLDQYVCVRWRCFLYEKYHVVIYIIVGLVLLIIGYVFLKIYNKSDKARRMHKDTIQNQFIYPYWIFGGLFGVHRAKLLSDFGVVEYTLTCSAILMNVQNFFLYIDRPSIWGELWQMSIVNIFVCVAAISIWFIDYFLLKKYQLHHGHNE